MTLLIKDVRILGGTRSFPGPSDIFVSDEKISAIGNFPNKKADVILDGQGAYLSPGFIDVNTDSDHYLTLFDHPEQDDFLKQGVTTIFGGMCGSSLAPLLYGSLESMGKWGDTSRVNVNWHTMGEFLEALGKRPLGVNFGTLVGHATIRRAIVGEAQRDLTRNELNVFTHLAKTALQEGGFGISSGLAYVHARKTPYAELKLLADLTKGFDGVYATHLREPAHGVQNSVEETIKLAKETGVKALINHFVPFLGAGKEYEAALAAVEALPKDANFRFDIYPSLNSLMPIYTFLPLWAQNGGVAVMLANAKDEWTAGRIKKDMPLWDEKNFVIAQAPGNDFFVGKSLKEIREIFGLHDSRDALVKLMVTMNMRGGVWYRNLVKTLVARAINSPRSFVASNAPSFDEKTPGICQFKTERTTKTFTDFLAMVAQGKIMPLEAAIAKLTVEPAKMFGLRGRGTITEGNFADLTCFRGNEILFTIVNGRVAMQNGECYGARAGKVLRRRPAPL